MREHVVYVIINMSCAEYNVCKSSASLEPGGEPPSEILYA